MKVCDVDGWWQLLTCLHITDTEDASETDVVLKYDNTDNEYTEIKEQ